MNKNFKILYLFLGIFLSQNLKAEIQNNIFLGGSIGAGKISQYQGSKPDISNSYIAFAWGVRGGYSMMPIPYVGFRTYLDYMMSIKPSGLDTITSSLLSLNADLLLQAPAIQNYIFGVYGGIGLGYFQHSNVVKTTPEDPAFAQGTTGVLNLGISLNIEENNQVELGIKIPFTKIKDVLNQKIEYKDNYLIATYSYLF